MNEPLLCPGCGDPYLHHTKVEVYDRDEDAATGTVITAERPWPSGESITVNVDTNKSMDACPSPRRSGIRVHLVCECCGATPYIDIIQHKGCTYINH